MCFRKYTLLPFSYLGEHCSLEQVELFSSAFLGKVTVVFVFFLTTKKLQSLLCSLEYVFCCAALWSGHRLSKWSWFSFFEALLTVFPLVAG